MYLRRRSTALRYFIAAFFGVVMYAEWLVYYCQQLFWIQHDCFADDHTCTKILFIADPQIEGNTATSAPYNYFAKWDSDRYLKSSFQAAMRHFKPDILVFLGDFMSEGSVATMTELQGYLKRLAKIFKTDRELLRVWVPGENDVGDAHEGVFSDQLSTFDKSYAQPEVIYFRNITFYKVSLSKDYPQKTEIDRRLKIVVSHYPILTTKQFSLNVENQLHPHIFFCGHEHVSKYMVKSDDGSQKEISWFYHPDTILDLVFNEGLLYEVYVPTCSYMWDSKYAGFGAAVLDFDNRSMRYTVFWSHSRIPYLILYAVLLVLLLVYCLVYGRRTRRAVSKKRIFWRL